MVDISTIVKDKSAKFDMLVGKGWNKRPPATDIKPGESYFVRTGDDNLVGLDFDLHGEHPRVTTMLVDHGFPVGDVDSYRICTVSDGEHYYCRVKQCGRPLPNEPFFADITAFYSNKNRGAGANNREGRPDIRGDSPGVLFFGKFKNGEYKMICGSEATIPWIEGWRVKWISGELGNVAGIDIGAFLDGKIDLKAGGVLKKAEDGWLVWINAMLALKKCGYTSDEADAAMSKIPGYDATAMKHDIDAYWEHPEKVKVQASTTKVIKTTAPNQTIFTPARINVIVEPGTDWYELRDDGIWHINIKIYQNGNIKTTIRHVWYWQSFVVHRVLIEKIGEEKKEYYDFTIDGNHVNYLTMDDIVKLLYPTHSGSSGEEKNKFGPVIKELARVDNIPTVEFSTFCGFGENGWVMPGTDHEIRFNRGLQEKQRPGFEKLMAMKVKRKKAKEYMKLLHDNTSIDHKDQFFARAIVQVFLNALMPYTHLSPIFSAIGPGGEGKSPMMQIMTRKIWGVPEKLFKAETFNSEARFGEYFSLSTFASVIDDSQDLRDTVMNTIKSMVTVEINNTRMTKERGIDTDKPMISSLNLTYNRRIAMFDDEAMLTRLYEVRVETKPTVAQLALFNQIESVPNAYIGRYIIKRTQSWTIKDLLLRYESIPNMPGIIDVRANTMYKLQMLGGLLMKEIFDIDLNLSDTRQIIEDTRQIKNDDMFNTLIDQVIDGQLGRKERPHWIDNDIKIGQYKEQDGILYSARNLADLRKHMGVNIKSLDDLYLKVKYKWPMVHYGVHEEMRSLFFPATFNTDIIDKIARMTILDAVHKNKCSVDDINKVLTQAGYKFDYQQTTSILKLLCGQGVLSFVDGFAYV
jgi:hypothetical protein